MYADDTKFWHEINCEEDIHVLQRDIDSLMDRVQLDCMKFYPSKCKALMVSKSRMPFIDILLFVQYYYALGSELID